MKNLNLLGLVLSTIIVFSSCSSNETMLPEEQSVDLLKTYKINRDATGAYSLDFELNEGDVNNVFNSETKTNQFNIYSSDNKLTRKVTQSLNIEGTELKVGFVDANSNNISRITLTDDDIRFAKKDESEKLKDFSISPNEDGTYNLDFKVNKNVKVDFEYNEGIDTYEIHLENGKSSQSKFSGVLEKENGKPLKFDFVNHNSNSKRKGTSELAVRKPKVIIDNGERDLF